MKKLLVILLLFGILFVSCKKKQDVSDISSMDTPKNDTITEQKVETVEQDEFDTSMVDENALSSEEIQAEKIEKWNKQEVLEDIYFGFDKASLSSESREVLANHARWIKNNSEVKVIIQGHCDERGTEQYNMALGDRRANAVKSYLISLGVSSENLRTQSFGEMFPKVKEHNDWAWAQNRRAHFVFKMK